MDLIQSKDAYCPYCGEAIELVIEASREPQQYIEDCQVCCKPMSVRTWLEGDDICLHLEDEDSA